MRISTPKIPIETPGSPAASRRRQSQDLPAKQGLAERSEHLREPAVVEAEWVEIYDARALPLNKAKGASNLQLVKAEEAQRLNPYEILPPGDPRVRKYSDIATPDPSPPGSIINIFA